MFFSTIFDKMQIFRIFFVKNLRSKKFFTIFAQNFNCMPK